MQRSLHQPGGHARLRFASTWTVSYTHLDVDKRQVHLNPDGYVEGRMEESMEPAAINRTRFTADLVLETTVNVILNGRAARCV